jgi:hypothetical protein
VSGAVLLNEKSLRGLDRLIGLSQGFLFWRALLTLKLIWPEAYLAALSM